MGICVRSATRANKDIRKVFPKLEQQPDMGMMCTKINELKDFILTATMYPSWKM